jgi:hypothetical protein
VVAYAPFPVVGGLLINALSGDTAPGAGPTFEFPAIVLAVFMITNLLNFSMVAGFAAASGGSPFLGSFRSMYVTVLPVEFAVALLTAGIALIYQQVGVGAVGLLAVVLFVFP